MAPQLTAKQKREYILAMADLKLTDQWNNSIEAWEKLKSVDTVNWRNESHMCVDCDLWGSISIILYSHGRYIHYLKRVLGVFKERALKTRMLRERDVAERNSVLWKMGVMKPDYDISLEDGLRYAMKFGIPLEEEWHLDSSVRPVENLKSFKIVDYKKVDQKYVVSICCDNFRPTITLHSKGNASSICFMVTTSF